MFTLLVAEDDFAINKMITTKLEQEHFQVHCVTNGEEALVLMEKYQIDLIITDIMMPKMDGYALLKNLRDSRLTTPVLMITAKSQLDSLEKAFKLGVDDYLVKPIRLPELVLRVQALLRRAQLESEHLLTFSNTLLDANAFTLTDQKRGNILQLPQKEFLLLYKLMSHPEKIFTRLDLLDHIWGMDEDRDERLVDACVKRLRHKIQDNPDFEILTVRGLGYKGRVRHD